MYQHLHPTHQGLPYPFGASAHFRPALVYFAIIVSSLIQNWEESPADEPALEKFRRILHSSEHLVEHVGASFGARTETDLQRLLTLFEHVFELMVTQPELGEALPPGHA